MPFQPTARCAALVALCAVACLVDPLLGLAALAVVLGVAAYDAAQARSSAPKATRTTPPFVMRGVPAAMRLDVEGTGAVVQPGTEWLEVSGRVPGPLTLVARRRGRHVLPAAVARVEGRLGLGAWTGPVTDTAELVVHPDVLAARRLARAAQRMTFDEEAGRARGPLGLGTSFESLRDYMPDDDIRLINWKATARTGKPVVNQFRLEQARDVVILVDAGRLMTGPAVFDAATDAATSLAMAVDAVGDRCGLIAFADRPLAQLAPRAGGGRGVAAAVASLEAVSVDSDYETAFRALPTKRAVAVIVTDLVDDAAAAAMLSAVPVLSRRHQVLVVAADDPGLAAMVLSGGGGSRRAAYRATAAAALLEERDRAAAGLRRAGASVVTAAPDRLAAAACAAYLDIKSRGRA